MDILAILAILVYRCHLERDKENDRNSEALLFYPHKNTTLSGGVRYI